MHSLHTDVAPSFAETVVVKARLPLFGLVVSLLVWAQLIYKLRLDWSTNAQYGFGPFVPVLIAVLIYQRWTPGVRSAWPARPALLWLGLGLLLLCLLPLRIVQEANPEWRPLNWVHAAVVVLISTCALTLQMGWRQAREFIYPMLLIFLALPWSLKMEQTVIQDMARAVSSVTVELLDLCGIPALQKGNVILVSTGPVGIADACSGIRSLAGTLMAAVFFGEFFRLRWWARGLLLILGVASAFFFNLIRAFTLSWLAATRGSSVMEHWHDYTGLLIFCAAFALLWMMAGRLQRFADPSPTGVSATPLVRPLAISLSVAAVVWIALVEAGTEGWYRSRESQLPHYAGWEAQWPSESPQFRFTPVTDEARAILRYSIGKSAIVEEPGALRWQIFYFRWEPGRSSAQLAVLHRPDICLPAAGLTPLGMGPRRSMELGGRPVSFESFRFTREGTPLFVFRTLSEDRRAPGVLSTFDQSPRGRLTSAWSGYRNLGERLLQVTVEGTDNEDSAFADLQARLPPLIRRTE